jgi:hypothetical protein
MTMALLNDYRSVLAPMIAAIPSAMQAAIVLTISELGARTAKTTLPIYIAVAADPNAELLRTCYGRGRDRNRRERGKGISYMFSSFIGIEKTIKEKRRSGNLIRIFGTLIRANGSREKEQAILFRC